MRKGVQGTASVHIYDMPVFFSLGIKRVLYYGIGRYRDMHVL